jgi:flavin reductase (DIM6/NTAB) family NADH-FMN oxidoreductase RutF
MAKRKVNYLSYVRQTIETLSSTGALLVSVDEKGKPNAMAIGWGTIGFVWRMPVFVVLVRPSRYTYGLIEKAGDFTVNIPGPDLKEIVESCGSVSGRSEDKFAKTGLVPLPSTEVKSPIIKQCIINYECKVVHKNDVIQNILSREIIESCYPKGDFHRLYYGHIVCVHADTDLPGIM